MQGMHQAIVPREKRGVYWARYTKNGRPICYAVDSRGEIIRRYVVTSDDRAAAAIESLWSYLDAVDPQAQLRLVKPALLPTTARTPEPEFDPYNVPLPGFWPPRH